LVTTLPASEPTRVKLAFEDATTLSVVCGQRSRNLKLVEKEADVSLHLRGNELTIEGQAPAVEVAQKALTTIYGFAKRGNPMPGDDIIRAVRVLRADQQADLRQIFSDTILVPRASRPITPKGLAQKKYVDAVRRDDIVFGIGPAGTGKTYLAMAMAVRALLDKEVKRIVLTRPAVEAGERLGFLPGTMEEKVNPYLRPLYDALHDMLDFDKVQRLMDKSVIEVAPLAFMRGRTLNDSFVIFDEAQNATTEQMKMFLTRLGFGSKAVVTGDVTQSDLPNGQKSGLQEAQQILGGIDGISLCYFDKSDVVRHPLVQSVINAYERFFAAQDRRRQGGPGRRDAHGAEGAEGAEGADAQAGRGDADSASESGETGH